MPRTKNPTFVDPIPHDTNSEEEEGGTHRVPEEQQEQEQQILSEEEEESGSEKDTDSEEGTEPLQPLHMYFDSTEYNKPIKIATRCFIKKAVDTIESRLNRHERRWFEDHP